MKALVGNQENNISDKNKELNNIIKINKKLANTIKSLSIKHKKLESNLFQYDKANNALSFKINQQKIDLQENKINLSKNQMLEDELNHYQKVLPFFLKEFSREFSKGILKGFSKGIFKGVFQRNFQII